MNIQKDCIQTIKDRLQQHLEPFCLEVIDESSAHIGHINSYGGGKHIAINIAAACFQGLSKVAVHRKIYALLTDLFDNKQIHALRITVLS